MPQMEKKDNGLSFARSPWANNGNGSPFRIGFSESGSWSSIPPGNPEQHGDREYTATPGTPENPKWKGREKNGGELEPKRKNTENTHNIGVSLALWGGGRLWYCIYLWQLAASAQWGTSSFCFCGKYCPESFSGKDWGKEGFLVCPPVVGRVFSRIQQENRCGRNLRFVVFFVGRGVFRMIFGESDLRNPLWSSLSVSSFFWDFNRNTTCGIGEKKGNRQGQSNHKALWKELRFPCCFCGLEEIFPQALKGSQEKKEMLATLVLYSSWYGYELPIYKEPMGQEVKAL